MLITFVCPSCGSTMRVADRYAGLRARCPKCHHSLTVPPPAPEEPDSTSWGEADAPAGTSLPAPRPGAPAEPQGRQVVVSCPHCHFAWEVGVELAGQYIPCRKCDCRVRVPGAELEPEDRAEAVYPDGARRRPKPVAMSAGNTEEVTLYSDSDGVRITNCRAIIGPDIYSMANVSSVSVGAIPPNLCSAVTLVVAGFLSAILFGLVALCAGEVRVAAIILAALGASLGGIGLLVCRSSKTRYAVRITAAGGECDATWSYSKKYIARVVDALNAAIVHRGVVSPCTTPPPNGAWPARASYAPGRCLWRLWLWVGRKPADPPRTHLRTP